MFLMVIVTIIIINIESGLKNWIYTSHEVNKHYVLVYISTYALLIFWCIIMFKYYL